jgi:CcmD family protein
MKNFESLFVAYLVVWAVFMVYQISVGLRLSRVQSELERLRELLSQR